MRDAQRIRYFEQAVLLALALPACGGSAIVIEGTGDGGTGGGSSSGGSSGVGSSSGGTGGSSGSTSSGGNTSSGGSGSSGGSSGAGSSGGSSSSSGGSMDAAFDAPLPSTPCDWAVYYRTTCNWTLYFTGDPLQCVGFAGSGTAAQCAAICGTNDTGQTATSCSENAGGDGGPNTLYCWVNAGPNCFIGNGGRRPGYFAALGFRPPAAGRELGTHFARAALMEAGSIDAFRTMRDELAAHGAPRRLVRAASRAMRDEMRHVRQTSALARRYGEQPLSPPPPPPRARRSLEEMATENAVEGCVRETYSALECLWQAETAADPVVRATMKRIARDEMRHLALAWAVHDWARGKLSASARGRLHTAQREAVATLLGEVSQDPHRSLVKKGGLPEGHQSRALISAIEARLAA